MDLESVPKQAIDLAKRKLRLGDVGALAFMLEMECEKAGIDSDVLQKCIVKAESRSEAKPSKPPSEVLDSTVLAEVSRLQQGFSRVALDRLEAWAFGKEKPRRKKLTALWELSKWFSNRNQLEIAVLCLNELLLRKPKGLSRRKAYVNLADTLVRAGRPSEAIKVLHPFSESGDLNVSLAHSYAVASSQYHYNGLELLDGLNRIYTQSSLVPLAVSDSSNSVLDSLGAAVKIEVRENDEKVSVVIPCFNCEDFLSTAVDSLLCQSWSNLEIILVDDCSTDGTAALIDRYTEIDSRVIAVYKGENGGAYAARNEGLDRASGVFFTCHDSDDYSHPQKIEKQVHAIRGKSGAVASLSPHVRLSEDFKLDRRGNSGFYVFPNLSSLMFRRSEVLKKTGYWDSVRFGADGEFKSRLERVFGKENIVRMDGPPLSLVRTHELSLTNDPVTGYQGYKYGARKEYEESSKSWYVACEINVVTPFIDFPQSCRPFPVPTICEKRSSDKYYDMVIMSEFRLPGGTTSSNAQEILASYEAGLSVGLVQSGNYRTDPTRGVNPKIRGLIEEGKASFIVFGESARTENLIVRFPLILDPISEALPSIRADNVRVIVNQPPQRTWNQPKDLLYDVDQCHRNLIKEFSVIPKWYPIGPTARKGFDAAGSSVRLESWDWLNLIDIKGWWRGVRSPNSRQPVIARHSRDHWSKWPETTDDILACYPDSGNYRVKVLGGADSAIKLVGRQPDFWEVFEFGAQEPSTFLMDADVYVYFTHSQYLEAFGRSIFEAMAVGVPVILPHQFEDTFKDAAIYSTPNEVASVVDALVSDAERYKSVVLRAKAFVESGYGYDAHIGRLQRT